MKYCIWCASDQIKVSIRMRKATTPEERIQHDLAAGLRTARLVAELFAGLFGFHPNPNDWTPQQPPGMRPPNNELEAELMKEGYKKLAMKYHPDKGGDPEKMKELNRLKEKLGL